MEVGTAIHRSNSQERPLPIITRRNRLTVFSLSLSLSLSLFLFLKKDVKEDEDEGDADQVTAPTTEATSSADDATEATPAAVAPLAAPDTLDPVPNLEPEPAPVSYRVVSNFSKLRFEFTVPPRSKPHIFLCYTIKIR